MTDLAPADHLLLWIAVACACAAAAIHAPFRKDR